MDEEKFIEREARRAARRCLDERIACGWWTAIVVDHPELKDWRAEFLRQFGQIRERIARRSR